MNDDKTRWPISLDEAESIWKRLESLNKQATSREPCDAKSSWLVGEHGNRAVVVMVLKDRRVMTYSPEIEDSVLSELPRIRYAAGQHSLVQYVRHGGVDIRGDYLISERDAERLPGILHSFFVYHATKPLPEKRALEAYDAKKRKLCVTSAEEVAASAFKRALKRAKPFDRNGFADKWACAALAHVMHGEADIATLTQEGVAQLGLVRDSNIHRTSGDLTSQALALNEQLAAEETNTTHYAQQLGSVPKSFLDARRASYNALQNARVRAISWKQDSPKPFSQRLLKGLVLARIANARLVIGSLSDSTSTALAEHYAEALSFMQDVEVVACGRATEELWDRRNGSPLAGVVVTCDKNGVILERPCVYLRTEIALSDPRIIFHEFQHARQHMASEEPVSDFWPASSYETEIPEWKAKQAEAELISKFGIMY